MEEEEGVKGREKKERRSKGEKNREREGAAEEDEGCE